MISKSVFDPREFGALADGVHDDSPAVEAAIAAAAGSRHPQPTLVFAPGSWRLSRTLRIVDRPLVLDGGGLAGGGAVVESLPRAALVADHPGPVIHIGNGGPMPEVAIRGLELRRDDPGGDLAHGIYVHDIDGGESRGLYLDGVRIVGMGGDGIHLDLGEAAAIPVLLRGCSSSGNRGWGFWCTGRLSQGVIRDSFFARNGVGGVRSGSFGLRLLHNRIEDEPRPVIVEGLYNRGVAVLNNVFAGVGAGRACIDLRHVHRFRVENNVFEPPGAAVPPVACECCSDGVVDVPVLLSDCADVVSTGGYLARTAYATRPLLAAACWSLSRAALPAIGLSPSGSGTLLRHTFVGPPPQLGLQTRRFGRMKLHVLDEDPHAPGRFVLDFGPQSNLENEDLAWIAFALRYTAELPTPDARVHLRLAAPGDEAPLASWALSLPPLLFVGETLLVVVGVQRARAVGPHAPALLHPRHHPHLALTVHAFGEEHGGSGAELSRAVMLRLEGGNLPGRGDLHPEARAYPLPMPLFDPFPTLEELVEHGRLAVSVDTV